LFVNHIDVKVFSLSKGEKLKSKKLIGELYNNGKSIKVFPLRLTYIQNTFPSDQPVQMGVTVPKRKFKKAVDRNRIKRLMRESYRLEKNIILSELDENYVFMISYLANEEWKYESIRKKMTTLLTKFKEEIKNHEK